MGVNNCLFCVGIELQPGAKCHACKRIGTIAPHHCHAIGCNVEVPPKLLMCKRHWFMLPKTLQNKVWAEYVPGQEVRKNPTTTYLEVMRDAINHVAKMEGRR